MTLTKKIDLSLLYLFSALFFAFLLQSSEALSSQSRVGDKAIQFSAPGSMVVSQPVPDLGLLPSTSLEKFRQQVSTRAELALLENLEDYPALGDLLAHLDADRPADAQGIYAPGAFALPIVQQPEGEPAYVSHKSGEVTRFQLADRFGVTGLLAHNYLSGREFYELEIDQEVWLVFGSHYVKRYRVSAIEQYQKLTPTSPRSEYLDLSTGETLTTARLFSRFYKGKHHLTLQTCLEKDGQLNWGLTFVVAVPLRG